MYPYAAAHNHMDGWVPNAATLVSWQAPLGPSVQWKERTGGGGDEPSCRLRLWMGGGGAAPAAAYHPAGQLRPWAADNGASSDRGEGGGGWICPATAGSDRRRRLSSRGPLETDQFGCALQSLAFAAHRQNCQRTEQLTARTKEGRQEQVWAFGWGVPAANTPRTAGGGTAA